MSSAHDQSRSRRSGSRTPSSRQSKDVVDTLADIFSNYSTSFEPGSDGKSTAEEFPKQEEQDDGWPSHKEALRRLSNPSWRQRSSRQEANEGEDAGFQQQQRSLNRTRYGQNEDGEESKTQTARHYSQSDDASRLGTLWRRAKSESREKDRTIASIKSRLRQGEEEQEK